MSYKRVLIIIFIILIADQALKIYIKTSFTLQQSLPVFSWFQLLFVENDGMAWGAKISDFIPFISERTAKLILTWFRIIAVTGIGYWLWNTLKGPSSKILIYALTLIFAGALGNIIDSVFYGVVFSESLPDIAEFLPKSGGYDTLFHGKVVDMLHFPIWKGYLPEWIPFYGGEYFTFFEPVFNLADMAISSGVGILLLFNRRAFRLESNN
ncbi:MAG: lipoprotein signal peptidase [Bacteroidia bacterium]|nr:lipoprotein signal peptidase [Bacteroidia bacterium]MBT8287088.1 lipoprotein signal peptidase [Bacteroidia bacterium]NNK73240.1 lipoprotein signal peptidase [Flavobacteriaceae bacterium]